MTNENDDLPKLPPLENVLRDASLDKNSKKDNPEKINNPNIKNCLLLERKTGDGRIEILEDKRIVCEYGFKTRSAKGWGPDGREVPYTKCKITNNDCVYDPFITNKR